jgi:hypothetical protein
MFFSVFVREDYYPQRFETRQALRLVDVALAQLEKNRASIELALDAAAIERINRQGKIAAVLDLEGGFDLDGDLGVLRSLYRLGLRSAQLSAHNWANNFADSCCAPPKAGVIVVHGLGVHPDFGMVGGLRTRLADAGYATLSVQMPVLPAGATRDDYAVTLPVAGSSAIWPETNRRDPARIAWEYGPSAHGAASVDTASRTAAAPTRP